MKSKENTDQKKSDSKNEGEENKVSSGSDGKEAIGGNENNSNAKKDESEA